MKSLAYKRTDRIKKVVHKEVAQLVQQMKDPRSSFVTITNVEITPDLQTAKIYYTVLNKNAVGDVESMFESAKGFIRTQLAHKLMLKDALEVKFEYDKYLEQTEKVLNLLDKIKDETNK